MVKVQKIVSEDCFGDMALEAIIVGRENNIGTVALLDICKGEGAITTVYLG